MRDASRGVRSWRGTLIPQIFSTSNAIRTKKYASNRVCPNRTVQCAHEELAIVISVCLACRRRVLPWRGGRVGAGYGPPFPAHRSIDTTENHSSRWEGDYVYSRRVCGTSTQNSVRV